MNSLTTLLSDIRVFVALVALVLLGFAEIGYRLGLRLFVSRDEARREQIPGLQGAILGLTGLLLGFTFSMAVNRYEARREMVLEEANAVGTTWLRASLLPEAHRAPVKELLRRFVDVRLEYQKTSDDPARLAEGLRLGGEIEAQLWQHAEAAAQAAPTPITATFIVALNQMIDTDAARLDAGRNNIPTAVWLLLIIVTASGCLTSSYHSGAEGVRSYFTAIFLPLLMSTVIFMIFDLRRQHQGMVSVSQQPLLDLRQTMEAAGR